MIIWLKLAIKLLKDENLDLLPDHWVIHIDYLLPKNISPVANELVKTIIKCMNAIKTYAKYMNISSSNFMKIKMQTMSDYFKLR